MPPLAAVAPQLESGRQAQIQQEQFQKASAQTTSTFHAMVLSQNVVLARICVNARC